MAPNAAMKDPVSSEAPLPFTIVPVVEALGVGDEDTELFPPLPVAVARTVEDKVAMEPAAPP